MKTDDILKSSLDSPASDFPSSSGPGAPTLENMGVQERSVAEEEPAAAEAVLSTSRLDGETHSGREATAAHSEGDIAVAQDLDMPAPRTVKRPSNPNRRPKLRNLNAEQAFELLSTARTADHVELYLRDGRMYDGAILFNDMKGTGRLINVTKEISVDFRAEQVRDIRF